MEKIDGLPLVVVMMVVPQRLHTTTSLSVVFVLILACLVQAAQANEPIVDQYCMPELLDIQCPHGHVILMESAVYGRMEEGVCSIGNLHIGCSANVLDHLDSMCTGHQTCSLQVNTLERIVQPCGGIYKSYLETAHICVPVVDSSECVGSNLISLDQPEGFIVGTAIEVSKSPSRNRACSYLLQVPDGQRVKIYLYSTLWRLANAAIGGPGDEGGVGGGRPPHGGPAHAGCRDQVTLQDEEHVKNLNPCYHSDGDERVNHVFTSSSSTMIVKMHGATRVPSSDAITSSKFIIKYVAVGCADFTAPRYARVDRDLDGSGATVRCNTSDQTWRITCRGTTWHGHVGNCSLGNEQTIEEMFGSNIPFQQGLALAIAVGVVVGTVIGALLLVCVYTIRKGNRETQMAAEKRVCQEGGLRPNCYVEEDRTNYPALLSRDRMHDGTIYTHVCDTHGITTHPPQATLLSKSHHLSPQHPFSTSTTFKLSSTSCLDSDSSPPVNARGLDIINNGCNTIQLTHGGYAITQPTAKLHLYETGGAKAITSAAPPPKVVSVPTCEASPSDNGATYRAPMYFDLAEPAATAPGGASVVCANGETESNT